MFFIKLFLIFVFCKTIHSLGEEKSNYAKMYQNEFDIHNEYLTDIQYRLIPTQNSVVAIGQKIPKYNVSDVKLDHGKILEKPKNQHQNQKRITFASTEVILQSVNFQNLKGWQEDNFDHALVGFLHNCSIFANHKKRKINIKTAHFSFGNIEDWMDLCYVAIDYVKSKKAKQFFEDNFTPFIIGDNKSKTSQGKFTGYHELAIQGSLVRTNKYKYPLYSKPKWCKSSSVCPTRKQINQGALKNMGLELCWVESQFDLWKLQIQGSGIVMLKNGIYLRISFGGTNMHKSKNVLDHIQQKTRKKNATQPKIFSLLSSNSKLATSIINHDPGYIFFKPNNKKFAIGAYGSGLTPSRSVAIDRTYIPYGIPLWVQTKIPVKSEDNNKWIPLNRLMVAQDTGKSIKGIIRADIFYGQGDKASFLANHTHFSGSYYALIPNKVVPQIKTIK